VPEAISFGGEDEAATYATDALRNWQATDGALTWLAGSL
jgi:hypothetical protein